MLGRDFDGWTVVVTGASTGLGRAIAVETAERGAALVVVNYAGNHEAAQETARLVEAMGAHAVLAQGDVGKDEDCRRIVEAAAPTGRIDALFNNAGTTKYVPDHSDLDALSAEDFLDIYRVNTVGPFQMVRAARSLLEAAPQPGAVVMTGSIAAVLGVGTSVAYAASKGALKTMTLSLAKALAPKIRVNCVLPGYIESAWFDKLVSPGRTEKLRDWTAESTPLKVASTAADIAAATVFLASPAARHVTGETLLVDAGAHMGWSIPPGRSAPRETERS
jgi:NAD(P)-dependent dehydrogenase (short-subunit alcohol dehydrogenase family)